MINYFHYIISHLLQPAQWRLSTADLKSKLPRFLFYLWEFLRRRFRKEKAAQNSLMSTKKHCYIDGSY
jgi:hypothetical protein